MKMLGRILVVCVALSVVGCSANHNSVFRHKELENASFASITTLDAKQRAILHIKQRKKSTETKDGVETVTQADIEKFCAEPSPDVFSVFAQAMSAGGSFGKSADPRSIEAALNAAFTSAENGSTIPRTQTVNMLRELMYRTCERYLNGGYSALELSVQAIRDQRLMISILAIEQLTGAVTPNAVRIGASGTATGGAGGDALVVLDNARKAKEAADTANKEATKKLAALNDAKTIGADNTCDAIDAAVKDKKDLTADQKKQQPLCNAAKTELASTTKNLADASDHYADLKRLATGAGLAAGTAVSDEAQAGIARAHTESVKDVAATVQAIVEKNFKDDTEIVLFCIKTLSDGDLSKELDSVHLGALRDSCLSYLSQRVIVEEQKVVADARESAVQKALADSDQFAKFWTAYKARLTVDNQRTVAVSEIKTLLTKAHTAPNACLDTAKDEASFRDCFMKHSSQAKRTLAGD